MSCSKIFAFWVSPFQNLIRPIFSTSNAVFIEQMITKYNTKDFRPKHVKRMYFVSLSFSSSSLTKVINNTSPIHILFCPFHPPSHQKLISKKQLGILVIQSELNTRIYCRSFLILQNENKCIKGHKSTKTKRMEVQIAADERCQQNFGLREADGWKVIHLTDQR